MATLGSMIRKRRKALGMKQEQLAEAAGVITSTVSRYENNAFAPPLDTFIRIADALEIDFEKLIPKGWPYEVVPDEATYTGIVLCTRGDGKYFTAGRRYYFDEGFANVDKFKRRPAGDDGIEDFEQLCRLFYPAEFKEVEEENV